VINRRKAFWLAAGAALILLILYAGQGPIMQPGAPFIHNLGWAAAFLASLLFLAALAGLLAVGALVFIGRIPALWAGFNSWLRRP
jgi:hypothetical protein